MIVQFHIMRFVIVLSLLLCLVLFHNNIYSAAKALYSAAKAKNFSEFGEDSLPCPHVVHFVVSVFNEDVAWISDVCLLLKNHKIGRKKVIDAWTFYVKNSDYDVRNIYKRVLQSCSAQTITLRMVPNFGREIRSFTDFILNEKIKEETFVFVQGNMEVKMDFFNTSLAGSFVNHCGSGKQYFSPLSQIETYPHRYFIHVANEKVVILSFIEKLKINLTGFQFHLRGEFIASAQSIKLFRDRWTPFFIKEVFPLLHTEENAPLVMYAIERLWLYFFTHGPADGIILN